MGENTWFSDKLGPFWWFTEKNLQILAYYRSQFLAFGGIKKNGRYIFQLIEALKLTSFSLKKTWK